MQRGEPKEGYRSHIGGCIAANMSCNQCLDWDWFVNSESVSATLYFAASLFTRCPQLLDTVQIIAGDDACHWRKSLEVKLNDMRNAHGTEAEPTAAMALYAKLLEKPWVVDLFHFVNHSVDDKYCQETTNPTLPQHAHLLEEENSESSEQLFRWMGRLKVIINSMPLSKATFYLARMVWLHNERSIIETCMTKMREAEVREVRAAYGLEPDGACTSAQRKELATLLLAGTREYDLSKMEKWRKTAAQRAGRTYAAYGEHSS
mmetsp:Transcript_11894/g.27535  ORF Transcript_11894/g.27535 Transcript_11894/m.27535 type:complete len:261 (-) Transcript_11894:84-866(-)